LTQLINWFFIIFLSFYVYLKIFKITGKSGKQIVLGIISAAALSVLVYFLYSYVPFIRFVFMIVLAGIVAGLLTRIKIDLALTGFALALGITYGFGMIATLPVYAILWLLSLNEYDIILVLFTQLLQFALIYGLFSIRRMRKGMLFLKDRGAGAVGLVISAIILWTIGMIPDQSISHEVRLIFVISALVSVVGIIIWWRKGLTKLYKKTV